jgi:hypothetical protein
MGYGLIPYSKVESLSANIRFTLYRALIRSIMTYACPTWKFELDTRVLKLQRLQKNFSPSLTTITAAQRSEISMWHSDFLKSKNFSKAFQSHSGPRPHIQFRNHFSQTVGFLGRVISPSQGRYLNTGQHKQRINAYTHQTSMP